MSMLHQPIAATPTKNASSSTTSHSSNLSSVRDVPICLTPTQSDLHPLSSQNTSNSSTTNSMNKSNSNTTNHNITTTTISNNAKPGDSRFTPLLLASPCSTSATIAKSSSQPLVFKPLASSSALASSLSLSTNSKTSPSSSNTILSPPLSPYHRSASDYEELKLSPYDVPNQIPEDKQTVSPLPSFLNTSDPFPVEDFSNYKLTISPWGSSKAISGNYKAKHLNFLDQYGSMGGQSAPVSSSLLTTTTNLPLRYLERKYKRRWNNSDLESDYSSDRPRTRRVVKELSLPVSDLDSPRPSSSIPSQTGSGSGSKVSGQDIATPPPPKKRRAPARDYSPITIQQQLLIDESIPDYSPSTDSLPNNTKCLKVEWKGQPMDLRTDPNLSKLHPAEVVLASTLRLPCNVYLDLKRRLFFEKVERLRQGKQFRRTDAQKACRIDVNKALRLFAVFEKVGWLNDDLFVKYL